MLTVESYKKLQIENTDKELTRLTNMGVTYITFPHMQCLLSEIGLKLDTDTKNYLHLYYNTANEKHYYETTTSPLDDKGISAYNINSEWYHKNLQPHKTELGRRLYELRFDYVTTIKRKGIKYIVSF